MKWDFATTSWSQVLAARDGATTASREALEGLCQAYWYPLYAFVRLLGHDPEASLDLTQAYFTELLEKHYIRDVDPVRGRFRAFLIASMKHFLSKERAKTRTAKRGGSVQLVYLDAVAAEERYRFEPANRITPEDVFERRWALTVLERALGELGKELSEAGKAEEFHVLRKFLTGEEPKTPYRRVAEQLGVSEGAVKVSVHRMRRRFGEVLRQEVAETVAERDDVDDELRHLLGVLTTLGSGSL